MKIKIYILFLVMVLAYCTHTVCAAQNQEQSTREYQVKAGYIYNFINFVDWPEEKSTDSSESINIGIVCGYLDPEHRAIFKLLEKKQIKNKPIKVTFYPEIKAITSDTPDNEQIETIKKCHILMICSHDDNEGRNLSAILDQLKGQGVLTIGETEGFVDIGGNVNFIVEGNKVRFEINLNAVKENKLSIQSKLLKLAKRVISN